MLIDKQRTKYSGALGHGDPKQRDQYGSKYEKTRNDD